MNEKKNHIDIYIFISVIVLLIFSIAAVYSASSTFALAKKNDFNFFFKLHIVKIAIGILVLFIGIKINYQVYRKITKKLLLLSIAGLMALFIVGTVIKGANRWIGISILSFQPSEFAKFALIFHLAFLLEQKEEFIEDFHKGFIPLLIWIGVISGFVMIQPNFSTGAMICVISFIMLFAGRVRLKHILMVGLSVIPLLAIYAVSAEYRMRRIMSFFGKSDAVEDVNYQLMQAIIGFGNGGVFGVGPGQSRQRDFFLPESYGDFIYAIIGEEYGFIGAAVIIIIFMLIMIRGFKIAKHAPDSFGRYLAVGITAAISLYAIVNAGVASGLLPTTGLPLPFLSYGGSSMIFTAFAAGVLLNISTHTSIQPREEAAYEEPVNEPIVGQVFK
jgi:cell division protein FtsW